MFTTFDKAILANSHFSLKLANDSLSCITFPSTLSITYFIITLSISKPPRFLSPSVANTLKLYPSTFKIVTSKVPPPKSYTSTLPDSMVSIPNDKAAAVGSFNTRSTLNPAISPACLVATLLASSKYAGTVITTPLTSSPNTFSASLFNFLRIIAETSSDLYVFPEDESNLQFGSPIYLLTY